jgi:hypothetical protein
MKKLILLLMLVYNFQANGQTKKETIDWLILKFAYSPLIMNESEQYSRSLKINHDDSFTIEDINYSPDVLLPDSKNFRWKTIFTGFFKDLNPNSVRTKTVNGRVFFYASCTNGRCITQQDKGPDYEVFKNPEVKLCVTADASMEDRGVKALVHLIKLCGGKKEAF